MAEVAQTLKTGGKNVVNDRSVNAKSNMYVRKKNVIRCLFIYLFIFLIS